MLSGTVVLTDRKLGQAELMRHRPCRVRPSRSAFAGFQFPPGVIILAVRWYLRYAVSYRDVEELLAERGIQVDHVTVFRWVERFTPLLIDAARVLPARPGRSLVRRRNLRQGQRAVGLPGTRAIDQFGQVIDVLVSEKRDLATTGRSFTRARLALALCEAVAA